MVVSNRPSVGLALAIAFLCGLVMPRCIYGADSATVAPSKQPPKQLPLLGEVFNVEGRVAFLILPPQKTAGAPTPWVWYAPTLPGLPAGEEKWMFERFQRAGIAIAGIDVGESYGSPEGRRLFTALHHELVSHHGLAKKACLLARSRGGLQLFNWAVEHPDSVACIAGIYPVSNLASYPGIAQAAPAYGMTEQQLTAKLSENNPIDRLEPLAKARVPIFLIHGDGDAVVSLAKNSGALAERYRRLGGPVTLMVAKGQGHNYWNGFFACRELVDFVIAHANGEAGSNTGFGPDQK